MHGLSPFMKNEHIYFSLYIYVRHFLKGDTQNVTWLPPGDVILSNLKKYMAWNSYRDSVIFTKRICDSEHCLTHSCFTLTADRKEQIK